MLTEFSGTVFVILKRLYSTYIIFRQEFWLLQRLRLFLIFYTIYIMLPATYLMHALFTVFLCFISLVGFAQSATLMSVPPKAISQLEDLKEVTKSEVASGKVKLKVKGRVNAELRPDLNRYLVISADDFLRVASNTPTKEAYLACIDKGLERVAPLTIDHEDRQQVAEFYQDLMEIVGLQSSEGKLATFVGRPSARQ